MDAGFTEKNTVQDGIVAKLVEAGWEYTAGNQLDRFPEQAFVEADIIDALVRLNPLIAENPERVDEVLPKLRTLALAVDNDGLVETNKAMMGWLRGLEHHAFVGVHGHHPIRLIDFDHPGSNILRVSDEVTFGPPGTKHARFDVVLWVNGFPLVVGETKSATDLKVSWVTGANDIDYYEGKFPAFFATNVVSFAADGKDFQYGATGASPQHWMPWGATHDQHMLADVLKAVGSMLTPGVVLDLLRDFTLYETPADNSGAVSLIKLVARYVQYEAVTLMLGRVHDGGNRGLIYHTQGSGKTLAMVFAAGQLLRDPGLSNPTIVLIADRVQLVSQMWDQFRTTDMPALTAPNTASELRNLLADKTHGGLDKRGLLFTTVHKFAGITGALNNRDNIIVLVDEAHRTQEGSLGLAMRAALPNARFFAFTGTPLATLDKNTFKLFGADNDLNRTLHSYTSDQSIADGMTVPIHVDPRLVKFNLDKAQLDEAFKTLVDDERLTDDEAETLAKKAGKTSVFFANPDRIRAVCADILDHFYSRVDPLGMKAQIVVYNRAACVAYHQVLTEMLEQRHYAGHDLDDAAVVMTVTEGKGEDDDWSDHHLSTADEEAVLKRFRTYGDPLKFLVVTSKLGTGFNAPIEGVMYLDKPIRAHTLFQSITRTNRPWRNPETGQDKRFGLIVDYVGLGDEFANAMKPPNADQPTKSVDVNGLIDQFEQELDVAMLRFAGIDITKPGVETLMKAQDRLPTEKDTKAFAAQYLLLAGIWEAISPDARLLPHKASYRFLSQIYAAVTPSDGDELLWGRLGAKTLALVHDHIGEVTVESSDQVVVADADTIAKLVDEGLIDDPKAVEHKTAGQIIDSIAERLKKRLVGPSGDHVIFKTLAERLDKLREQVITTATNSIEWLREAFTLAADLTDAEKADDEAGTQGLDLLPDPRVGALTQIFEEYAPADTPVMIKNIVLQVDEIVRQLIADNSGWASTQKGDRTVRQALMKILRDHQLWDVPNLYEKAYEYIAMHYD